MSKLVKLADIAVDSGTQIRASIDQQVVADYAEAMTNDATFPPIVLFHDGNTHHIGDGFHRLMAAQRNQMRDIPADVQPGTQQDALWFALGANKTNGKRLSEADKRHAVDMALTTFPEISNNRIADQVGCSESYVHRIKAAREVPTSGNVQSTARVIGKDGKSYPATSPGTTGMRHPKAAEITELAAAGKTNAEIREAVGIVSFGTIAKVRKQIGKPGTVDKSRAAVGERIEQMREMAANGHTSPQIASAVGLSEQGCRDTMRRAGIDVPADSATRGHRRHDSNRIVERMVMDAENLTADENLIDFSDLNRDSLTAWIDSLTASQKALGSFIRKLKEQQKHGQAA